MFRVMRVAKLAKFSEDSRRLLGTIYVALPAVANVAGLLVILFFVYAVMGVQICGYVGQDVRCVGWVQTELEVGERGCVHVVELLCWHRVMC